MFGKAKIEIPRSGNIGPSQLDGISDVMALGMGRIAAMTLSEQDGYVVVTLSNTQVKVIGHDTTTGEIVIGRLVKGR